MNIYPDWLLNEVVGGGGGGTIIIGGLEVQVASELSVSLEGEIEAALDLTLPVPVDPGQLLVTLEGELTIEMDVCQ